MKKNVKAMALAATLILGGAFILGCSDSDDDDDEWISYAEISDSAREKIEKSFGKLENVKSVKKDDDSYEVYLNDGTKIDFDLNGTWKEIDNNAGIPAKYFETDSELVKIKAWADKNHSGKTIEEVDRKPNGFEIDFLNGSHDVPVSTSAL